MHSLRILIAAFAGAAALACCAESIELTGYIGCHKRAYSAREITDSAAYTVDAPADYLAVTEVYPDTPSEVRYHYRICAGGRCIYERDARSTGFGPVTYFVSRGRGAEDVTIENLGATPVLISEVRGVRGVRRAELDSLLSSDSFRLMGLVPPGAVGDKREEIMKLLADNLPQLPQYGITRGFSYEVRYANVPPDKVREQVDLCARWTKQYGMPAMLGLVTWWSGSPVHEPDGQGGEFGDIQYQQVCYSPDFENPVNDQLKAMLGERYNPHYCLSIPNQWSSTPWLTMNSPSLNDYRFRRLDEVVRMLKETPGDGGWIDSVFLENEPRYWDTECEAGNPKSGRQGQVLWADFNPCVTKAAQEDGINLDPSDGLSSQELSWLHRNVGRYNQDIVDAARRSLAAYPLRAGMPVYTHTLQHRSMFPGGPINHPASEWGCAENAWSGIEGIWSQPSDFYRLREWGRWANVNREENDGRHIDVHLWDLRVAYAMGGELYNSYNWQAIGAQRVFDYMTEFLREFPVVRMAPAEAQRVGDCQLSIKTPMKLQAFDHMEAPVEVLKPVSGYAIVRVSDEAGSLIGWARAPLRRGPGEALLSLSFPTLVESPWRQNAALSIEFRDAAGEPVTDAVRFTQDAAQKLSISLDLRAQRALSLWVIGG